MFTIFLQLRIIGSQPNLRAYLVLGTDTGWRIWHQWRWRPLHQSRQTVLFSNCTCVYLLRYWLVSLYMRRPMRKLVKRHFIKNEKNVFEVARPKIRVSHATLKMFNFGINGAISVNFCFICSSTPLQFITHHIILKMRVHHYTRSSTNSTLTTGSVDRRLRTSYAYTLQTENIMFLHNIMFWASVALVEFSYRALHMLLIFSFE